MKKTLMWGILALLIDGHTLNTAIAAPTYELPKKNLPSPCKKKGGLSKIVCNGDVDISDNSTVTVPDDESVTWDMQGNDLTIGQDVTFNSGINHGDLEIIDIGDSDIGVGTSTISQVGSSGDITIGDSTDTTGNLETEGDLDIGSNTSVNGDAEASGDMDVGSQAEMEGGVDVGGDMTVGDNTTFTAQPNSGSGGVEGTALTSSPPTKSAHDLSHFEKMDGGSVGPSNVKISDFSGNVWDYVFAMEKDNFRNYACTIEKGNKTLNQTNVEEWCDTDFGNKPRFLYVNGINKIGNLGSEETPVITVISEASKCPKINGGPEIYGIIYFESTQCDGSQGGAQGWGNATIYGSVVWENGVNKLNANTDFKSFESEFGNSLADNMPNTGTFVPGSWRDFEPE